MSDYVAPAFSVALPCLGGVAGAFITRRRMDNYYDKLKLPSWRPPRQVFGPVWSALYCTMGYSAYMVWRDGGGFGGDAATPLAWYGTQLALNWAFTPLFFGLRSPTLGLVDIVLLWGGIQGTIYNFYFVNETAAKLLLPYLGWVSFATALTAKIWYDNRPKASIKELGEEEEEKKE